MSKTSERIIKTNGISLNVVEEGQGPLVLLCHGFPESVTSSISFFENCSTRCRPKESDPIISSFLSIGTRRSVRWPLFNQSLCESVSRTIEFMCGDVGDLERRLACDEAIMKAAVY